MMKEGEHMGAARMLTGTKVTKPELTQEEKNKQQNNEVNSKDLTCYGYFVSMLDLLYREGYMYIWERETSLQDAYDKAITVIQQSGLSYEKM